MVLKLLRASQIAELLNTSEAHAYLLMRRGVFPVIRVGRLRRVRQEDIENYIADQVAQQFATIKTGFAAGTANPVTRMVNATERKEHLPHD